MDVWTWIASQRKGHKSSNYAEVLLNVSSNRVQESCIILCSCLPKCASPQNAISRRGKVTGIFTFLHCVLSNVSSNGLPVRMHSHIGCICLIYLHCVFSNAPSKHLNEKIYIHTDCICLNFLHCVFSNVSSNCLPMMMHSHTGCICLTFLHCAFSNVCTIRWIVTLIAFV